MYSHLYPVNTKHLYNICTTSAQRLRRWTNIVQMFYKCFGFTGKYSHIKITNHISTLNQHWFNVLLAVNTELLTLPFILRFKVGRVAAKTRLNNKVIRKLYPNIITQLKDQNLVIGMDYNTVYLLNVICIGYNI